MCLTFILFYIIISIPLNHQSGSPWQVNLFSVLFPFLNILPSHNHDCTISAKIPVWLGRYMMKDITVLVYTGQTRHIRFCQQLSEHRRVVRTADFYSFALAEHVWSASHPVDYRRTLASSQTALTTILQKAIFIRSTTYPLNRDTGNL